MKSGEITTFKQSVATKYRYSVKKIIIEQQRNLLPEFQSDPELLVGKTIKHKCFDDNHIQQWYTATVNLIDTANKDPLKVKYEVHFEQTGEDELYSMNLLKDLQKGDLIIVE